MDTRLASRKGISQLRREFLPLLTCSTTLTSTRSYREKSSADEALQYLQDQANLLFDPEIVEALTKLPYKEFIEGEKTIV